MNSNLLNAIKEISTTFPNVRFGQLLDNALTSTYYGYGDTEYIKAAAQVDLFYLTDDELAAKLREYAKNYGA